MKQLEAAATQETEPSPPRSSGNYSGSGSESLGRLRSRPASAPSLASERLEELRVSLTRQQAVFSYLRGLQLGTPVMLLFLSANGACCLLQSLHVMSRGI